MDVGELLERIEAARVAALADRDETHRKSKAAAPELDALARRIEAQCSHAVAVALGRILGKETPAPQ